MKLFKNVAISLLLFSAFLTAPANASEATPLLDITNTDIALVDNEAAILEYVVVQDRGLKLSFDMERAIAAGASPEILETGEIFNDYSLAVQDPYSRWANKVWGHWCGPRHSGPQAPMDDLDAACMRHDECYGANGYFKCFCDANLIAEIESIKGSFEGRKKHTANAIVAFFKAARLWCRK
ncbi:hypothetical protein [Corynebacterium caspium]|uniref:hypothetical protein n=1 Tax=Corynebacterium caspium TaxID=234828 RepID=UPI00036D5EA1|nr:hypothetical protein [Corynebacterium caspium]WKD58596.1 hypothetical protein CCASP_00845 [Corynebacterium caspium DSM 44850]